MDIKQDIQKIQKIQRRISIISGVVMGILLSVYFFTFATLIDHGMFGLLLIEIVTSIGFIFAYIFMNRISFRLTRLFLGRRYARTFDQIQPDDINKSPAEIINEMKQGQSDTGT